ncbi:MAG: leucyl/phenylalanyl-tRNA--protein transferase [Nannocystaceae bacterium]
MTVFLLSDALAFPDPRLADDDGLLAVGGDLSPERLVLAYAAGIFPWSSAGEPLMWWSPAPRMVLPPAEIHVGRSLERAIRRAPYRLTLDTAFEAVLRGCAEAPRPGQSGTWITDELFAGMVGLHRAGVTHSVEAWVDDELVGGLYGLALGSIFCGESMFARRPDASKIAFVALTRSLERWGFDLIDCQQATPHLRRFGAREIEREDFLARLAAGIRRPWRLGSWRFDPAEDGDEPAPAGSE